MKILIICQDNIGDLVFTTALIQAIYAAKKDAEIQILTRSDTSDVAEFFPHIEHIYPQVSLARLNPLTRFKAVRAYFESVNWIKSQSFDIAISVSKNWRLGTLMKQAGVPVRIGFTHPKLKPWLTHPVALPNLKKPVITELLSLLTPLNITSDIKHYQLDMAKVLAKRAQCLSKQEQEKKQSQQTWFGLHAFASLQNRCVDLKVWLELADALIKKGLQPIWFGAPVDMQKLRDYNEQHNQGEYIGQFCDELCSGKLIESIPLLSLCDAYIGHDSGVLHLASAMGLKTLGVFTPGEPLRTFAQGVGDGQTFHCKTPQEVDAKMLIEQAKICFSGYFS